MKTKCYSVRLNSLSSYSEKSYLAIAFDGSKAYIPKSCVFGMDYSVQRSDAYWIAAWILEKREIQYSSKKVAWFDEYGNIVPDITIERHSPNKIEAVGTNKIENLHK